MSCVLLVEIDRAEAPWVSAILDRAAMILGGGSWPLHFSVLAMIATLLCTSEPRLRTVATIRGVAMASDAHHHAEHCGLDVYAARALSIWAVRSFASKSRNAV